MLYVDVIFLNGVYVDPIMIKGFKGFHLFHECEYFKERIFFHKDNKEADKWLEAVRL